MVSRLNLTTLANDRYIAVVGKRNRRAISSCGTCMVAASIGKTIFTIIVHQELHMNELYARIPSLCSSTRPIQMGTIKVMSATYQLDGLGQSYGHG